jgi:hypothetical protein
MLKFTDLTSSKEMASGEMAGVRGGFDPFAIFDSSTSIYNKVANVTQAFNFQFAQANAGTVTNNQAIQGGNGVTYAPVDQTQYQDNYLDVSQIGNVSVS